MKVGENSSSIPATDENRKKSKGSKSLSVFRDSKIELEVCLDSIKILHQLEEYLNSKPDYRTTNYQDKQYISSIEICSSLSSGGLTPSIGLVKSILNSLRLIKCKVRVKVLVRPRGGDHCYDSSERDMIICDVQEFIKNTSVRDFVLGFVDVKGNVDLNSINVLMTEIKKWYHKAFPKSAPIEPIRWHFSRAFDQVRYPLQAMKQLYQMGFTSILTSAGQASALDPIARSNFGKLKKYSLQLVDEDKKKKVQKEMEERNDSKKKTTTILRSDSSNVRNPLVIIAGGGIKYKTTTSSGDSGKNVFANGLLDLFHHQGISYFHGSFSKVEPVLSKRKRCEWHGGLALDRCQKRRLDTDLLKLTHYLFLQFGAMVSNLKTPTSQSFGQKRSPVDHVIDMEWEFSSHDNKKKIMKQKQKLDFQQERLLQNKQESIKIEEEEEEGEGEGKAKKGSKINERKVNSGEENTRNDGDEKKKLIKKENDLGRRHEDRDIEKKEGMDLGMDVDSSGKSPLSSSPKGAIEQKLASPEIVDLDEALTFDGFFDG
eukprot:g256.t1